MDGGPEREKLARASLEKAYPEVVVRKISRAGPRRNHESFGQASVDP